MRHSRISTAIAVGVLAVVMLIPGVGAAAAGPAVRAEMGTPVIDVDARTWTFTPRLYDADGGDADGAPEDRVPRRRGGGRGFADGIGHATQSLAQP